MPQQFLNGIELIQVNDGARPMQTVRSSVIGLVGDAPDADSSVFPFNEPVAIIGGDSRRVAALGQTGSLRKAVDDIFGVVGASVVVVRTPEGESQAEDWSFNAGSPTDKTGVWAMTKAWNQLAIKPKLLIATGKTGSRPTNGIQRATLTDTGDDYTSAPTVTAIGDGIGAKLVANVIAGKVESVSVIDPGRGYTYCTLSFSGGGGDGAAATAILGKVANPVAKSLEAVAARMWGFTFIDCDSADHEGAVDYRRDFGSDRVMILHPNSLNWDRKLSALSSRPCSATAAAMQCKIDNEQGFWHSFGNEPIPTIGGTALDTSWDLMSPDTDTQYLNANQVTTVVRTASANQGGYSFWGWTSTSSDPMWQFMQVRRTADMINETVVANSKWVIGKTFGVIQALDSTFAVDRYLASLTARGAIIGGNAWFDPRLNTRDQLMAGGMSVSFDQEPPAPIVRLNLYSHRNTAYYDVAVEEIVRQLAIAA
jgi:hypothetical protein